MDISSSSDDSEPLLARLNRVNNAFARAEAVNSDDETSPVPDWIQDTQTPSKVDLTRDSSDDDIEGPAVGDAKLVQPPKPSSAAQAPQTGPKPAAKGLPPGASRRIPVTIPKNLRVDDSCIVRFAAKDPALIDVSGDAAVIGRILAAAGTTGQRLIDWKGQLFQTAEVALAGTLLHVNVQPEAAKVAAVISRLVHAIEVDGDRDGPGLELSDSDDGYMSEQPVRKRDKDGKEGDAQGAANGNKAIAKRSKKALKAGAAAKPGAGKKGKGAVKKKKMGRGKAKKK